MKKSRLIPLLVTLLVVAAAGPSSGPGHASADTTAMLNLLGLSLAMLDAIPEPLVDPLDPPGFFQVKPQEFDPGKTHLVQAAWLHGTGCPTNATIALPNSTFTGVGGFSTFTDPACLNDFDADSAMHRLSRFRVFSGIHATQDSRSASTALLGGSGDDVAWASQ